MQRDVRWMYALPQELVKLDRGPADSRRTSPALYPIGNNIATGIVGGVYTTALSGGSLVTSPCDTAEPRRAIASATFSSGQ